MGRARAHHPAAAARPERPLPRAGGGASRRAGAVASIAARDERACFWLLCICLLVLAPAGAGRRPYTYDPRRQRARARRATTARTCSRSAPRRRKRVLVLVPGTFGGAGRLPPGGARHRAGACRACRSGPGTGVRNALEDTSVFERGNPDEAFAYYLNFQPVRRPQLPAGRTAPRTRRTRASGASRPRSRTCAASCSRPGKRGRKVILGGHSLGGSTVDGLRVVGLRRPARLPRHRRDGADRRRARLDPAPAGAAAPASRSSAIDEGDPFADLLGLNLPWAAGVFAETGALFARKAPDAPRCPGRLPAAARRRSSRRSGPPTRPALATRSTSTRRRPRSDCCTCARAQLAPSGDPRPWQDGENTPVQRLARTFGTEPANGVEWYFPRRLPLDLQAASALRPTPAARVLGVRVRHARAGERAAVRVRHRVHRRPRRRGGAPVRADVAGAARDVRPGDAASPTSTRSPRRPARTTSCAPSCRS